jgi:hypothetical protein
VPTENGRMRATLNRAGFRSVGQRWEGGEKRSIGLLVRAWRID